MADFCTNCVRSFFPEGEVVKPDIDVDEIFKVLAPGELADTLCEGCGLYKIGNFDGELRVRYIDKDGWYSYEVQK